MPGSSVHGILQAKIVEWIAYPFSRGSSQPRDRTQVSCIAGGFFTVWTTREASLYIYIYTQTHTHTYIYRVGISFTWIWLRSVYLSEKAMAPHSSTRAWKIPWTEEPGGWQSMGSLRVGHDWATHSHFSLSCIWEGNGNSLQCSCLENPRDGGAWWAAVHGVAQSRTRLKWLSSSSSVSIKR